MYCMTSMANKHGRMNVETKGFWHVLQKLFPKQEQRLKIRAVAYHSSTGNVLLAMSTIHKHFCCVCIKQSSATHSCHFAVSNKTVDNRTR